MLGLRTLVGTGSRSTAFKGIFSGGFFPGGFYPVTIFDMVYADKKLFLADIYLNFTNQNASGSRWIIIILDAR